jgi:hypothetical protein
MKYGVLTFSYSAAARTDADIARLCRTGVNLGDNVQTLAMRAAYARLGIDAGDIVEVDRDTLPAYDGPPVILPMNACFYDRCFPLPPQVHPVFVGFQARAPVVARHAEMLRRHAPIGCRDHATAAACRDNGIEAQVTGCLSTTFDRRTVTPDRPQVMIVAGAGAGALPAEVLHRMPQSLLAGAEFVYQRLPVARVPLSRAAMAEAEAQAAALLDHYRDRATLVVTPLHHAAAPCMAMGIPVVLCRRSDDARFSVLSRILPLHLPPFDAPIDWAPVAPDLSDRVDRLMRRLRRGLQAARKV